MGEDFKNGLVACLDSNFGYTDEEKAEVVAEIIMRYLRDAGVVKPVRCKDCIHKPHYKGRAVYADDPSDFTCPYLCSADPWEAGVPDDDFFCADGERKREAVRLSLSHQNTEREIYEAVHKIAEAVDFLRSLN